MSNDLEIASSRAFFANLIVHARSEIVSCLAPYTSASPLERTKLDSQIGHGSSLRCIDVWRLFASDEFIQIVLFLEKKTSTSFIEWFDILPAELELLLDRDMRIFELAADGS